MRCCLIIPITTRTATRWPIGASVTQDFMPMPATEVLAGLDSPVPECAVRAGDVAGGTVAGGVRSNAATASRETREVAGILSIAATPETGGEAPKVSRIS